MRAVLVPVKSFRLAKIRLAPVLDDEARKRLARDLAEIVVSAAKDAPVHVVCDDGEVADWAVQRGATVLYAPGLGLSAAVEAGVKYVAEKGFSLAVVAHADLPFVTDLTSFGSPSEVTLAPDRKADGTNVAAVPASAGFHFSYGPGSFDRHRREAERLGLRCTIVDDWRLSSDVDLPADLELVPRAEARLRTDAPGRPQQPRTS
ncbi:MAG TPA: 2-phospho-L-lactate guanylyltransferase [Acidimicrobiales bacterium]|nr:2-phospho-L-lactate guanylyltransferase [Acidimicrobiales bacterium]